MDEAGVPIIYIFCISKKKSVGAVSTACLIHFLAHGSLRTMSLCFCFGFFCMCVCPVNPKCEADILKEYESCDGTGFYGSLLAEVRLLHILLIF